MRRALRPLMWLQLQVLVAMVTDAGRHGNNYTAPSVINVGLLQPLEGPLGFERTGSAATMAVRDAQRRGYLNQTEVRCDSIKCFVSLAPSYNSSCHVRRTHISDLITTFLEHDETI